MDDLAGAFLTLAIVGLLFGATAIVAVEKTPPSEPNHPRPQVVLRSAPPATKDVRVIADKNKIKGKARIEEQQTAQVSRLSEQLADVRAEEPAAPRWSPMDIH